MKKTAGSGVGEEMKRGTKNGRQFGGKKMATRKDPAAKLESVEDRKMCTRSKLQ
jgi:hypothetical protein